MRDHVSAAADSQPLAAPRDSHPDPHRRNGARLLVLGAGSAALALSMLPGLATPASAHPQTYTVRGGDTLASIAATSNSTWQQVFAANRDVISSPTRIYPGQVLRTTTSLATEPETPDQNSSSATPPRDAVTRLLAAARQQEGVPYVYGGSTPSGFDCSGFTSYVFAQAGKQIPRTSAAQSDAAVPVARNDLRPGDLIFYSPGDRVSHVAIYAGGGMVWEAPGTGRQVRYAPVWDVPRSYGRF